jgi:hypothetical protein
MTALKLGIGLGLIIEALRKVIRNHRRYQEFVASSRTGRVTGFLLDAVFLPSPYAAAFGGFVERITIFWWAAGGVVVSVWDSLQARFAARRDKPGVTELPSDMSTTSLVGGGLIAGDSLAALGIGIAGLLKAMLN